MIKIAITSEDIRDDESAFIKCILDAGWDWVHLRHPSLSYEQMRSLIEDIAPAYYPRIKLHFHPELVEEYSLGGFHLNSRTPEVNLSPERYSISRSCHSIDEVRLSVNRGLDYVTLSPIFESVSKRGYKGEFGDDTLSLLPANPRVIALGGITPGRLPQLHKYNFAGFAVLGYLAKATSTDDLKTILSEFN